MRLVSFSLNGDDWRIGALENDADIIDLTATGLPPDMLGFVEMGAQGLERARAAVARADSTPIPLAGAKLGAPFTRLNRNIFCVGKNYMKHAREFSGSGFDNSASVVPEYPVIFTKPSSAVIGPDCPIPAHLDPTSSTDYEGELAVVIGSGGMGISRADAPGHVFGYTIVNDVTARELQKRHGQWFIGKSIDGFCPMGPCLATRDEVDGLTRPALRTYVNGELRQHGYLEDLIFDVPSLIETISRTIRLQPGDIIATGTPEGVGVGFDPPKYLKAGDIVRIAIDGVGELLNPVH
jgi:2-keto-4-pentenoate hydratase/2-oxohepta-3-ene-1,7-dioic acid hydratase in catechol pathway